MADIMQIKEWISKEEESIRQSKDSNEIVNRIYNLISVKHDNQLSIYVDIKTLIREYPKLVEINQYGYDSLCYEKIFSKIDLLSHKEQISLLHFMLSIIAREFPEFDTEIVQDKTKEVKINQIRKEKSIKKIPQAILLYSSLKISTLLIVLSLFIVFVYVLLLPAPVSWMSIFEMKYENYSNNFLFNHLLNILSLFGGIDNDCNVNPLNTVGLLELIIGKIIFVLLIVNFVYKKIIDKIAVK